MAQNKTMSQDFSTKRSTESFDDYALRLYQNRGTYGYSHRYIASLLNRESGLSKGESAWRKFYAGFMRGVNYAAGKQTTGQRRILALSDFHFPFALPVSTFSQYADTETLVLNGDILDCQSISSFPKLYRVPVMEEMIGARNYLIDLLTLIQPKEVYITVGNHEHRLGKYLAAHMDTDMMELMPDTSLDYIVTDGFYHYDKRLGIKTWYEPIMSVFPNVRIHFDGDWKCKVGKTIFCHPLTFSSSIMKTTEKAVNHFFRTETDFDAVVLGHTHKLGFYPQGNIALYEMGTCSDVSKLDYMNGKLTDPQQTGFLFLIQNEDGSINTNETKLVKL